MKEQQTGIEWFMKNVKPLLDSSFECEFVNDDDGDLGDLSGVQFNSDTKGGYIYFWSHGFVGYQLVDYENDLDLITDKTEEVGSRLYDEIFEELIFKLK